MMKWRITCIDTTTGEIYAEELEHHGFPSHLCEPYSTTDTHGIFRTGLILRVEKILYAT